MKIGVLGTDLVGQTISRKLVELARSSRARREGNGRAVFSLGNADDIGAVHVDIGLLGST